MKTEHFPVEQPPNRYRYTYRKMGKNGKTGHLEKVEDVDECPNVDER